jgi:hypothetical protein
VVVVNCSGKVDEVSTPVVVVRSNGMAF